MKIFNLSHHKCATTSVHHALVALGFRSSHWYNRDPDYMLKIHLEGTAASEPIFKEDGIAWHDLPIGLMYRELYEVYPDAVFLFVRRDRLQWLESIRKHFAFGWPAVLTMHSVVYGYPIKASNFEPRTCLRAYDRLCRDIVSFFQGKPNFHLIEMENLSWEPLCKAVGKPVPDKPFPWINRNDKEIGTPIERLPEDI